MGQNSTTRTTNPGSNNNNQRSYFTSQSEIENTFFNYAADAGVSFTKRPLIADSVLHRVHVDGDKPGTKNGAYILHPDGNPAAFFMSYSTGIKGNWTLSGKSEPLTKAIKAEIDRERQRRSVEQQARHEEAVKKAVYIWSRSIPVINHKYLSKKHIKPYGARLYGDALVIPIYDENKRLVNLQFINADGIKRFLSGGRKKGCFSVIGKPDAVGLIQICEGWATGASLFEATGHFTVIALDAGNLKPVAQVIRRLYPNHEIIICGDNDESGVGQEAARLAALACGGKYILPATIGHDWNDSLNMEVV